MIGIIGGTNLQNIHDLKCKQKEVVRTPFGIPSAPVIRGELHGQPIAFLARHGLKHTIPPHLINYRANIWALHHIGCKEIFAFSAMCSISPDIRLGDIVIPDQLIDYTWDRQSTFFSSQIETVHYTEFAEPYAAASREKLIATAKQQACRYIDTATYGVTQGPRYETRAEIRRYQNDGCDLLGMTGMPETSLAQEIQLNYAVCGLVTNSYLSDRVRSSATGNCRFKRTSEVFEDFLSKMLQQASA